MRPPGSRVTPDALVRAVRRSETFEAGARLVLTEITQAATRWLAQSSAGAGARVLRSVLHMRPEDAYRGLVVLDDGAGVDDSLASRAPSATAWRLVRSFDAPVQVDVLAGAAVWKGGSEALRTTFESRPMLLSRDVTHILAIPLRDEGVVGMVSLEVNFPQAIGTQGALWRDLPERLERALDAGVGPALLHLRPGDADDSLVDELLPVVGHSMAPVIRTLGLFAQLDDTLLLRGATGVGKSHLARWVWQRSPRAERGFHTVNLHTVPENLQEGELFGWRKGAFTGAHTDRAGVVRQAEGGTLFLDEADKLPLSAQAKLLSLLEERRYRELGGGQDRAADVRYIIGTNADLEARVSHGSFLRDLYYRINVLAVEVPPLSARRDEVPAWAEYMLRDVHAQRRDSREVGLERQAASLLAAARWDGNLRELRSVVTRAYAFAALGRRDAPKVAITADHVRQALGSASSLARDDVHADPLEAMRAAARAFAQLARAGAAAGDPLDLELAAAFKGLVLEEAASASGGQREAFVLFGREALLRGGNYLQVWRREQERVEALRAELERRSRT